MSGDRDTPSLPTRIGYIALGGNLGDVPEAFRLAIARLEAFDVVVEAVSALYRTVPVIPAALATDSDAEAGMPDFFNAVARVRTSKTPEALLECLHRIEAQAGRQRLRPNESRPLDLDLLLLGDLVCATPNLVLPHPRMAERLFVLRPMVELAPDLRPPGSPLSIRDLLARHFDPNQGILERIDPWRAPRPG